MGVAFVFVWFSAFTWLLSRATVWLCDLANQRGLELERMAEDRDGWL